VFKKLPENVEVRMLRAIVILSITKPIEGEKPQHQLLQTQFDLVILLTRQDDVTEYTEHSFYHYSSANSAVERLAPPL